jgi:hypothetical protein
MLSKKRPIRIDVTVAVVVEELGEQTGFMNDALIAVDLPEVCGDDLLMC